MAAQIVLSFAFLLLLALPLVAGVDTRDGRDWQPRDGWTGRRGDPHS